MDNQQYNLNQQPQQSGQPTAQPTPESPKSNKFWPINWKHNKFLKIIGITDFVFKILWIITINQFNQSLRSSGEFAPLIPLLFLGIFGIIIFFTTCVLVSFSIIRRGTIDLTDKIFLIISIITFILIVISVYPFIDL